MGGRRSIRGDVRTIALLRMEAERRAAKRVDLEVLARTVALRCSNTFVVLGDRGDEVSGERRDPQG